MAKKTAALACLLVFGCATAKPAAHPLFDPARVPETRAVPPDPRDADLSGFAGDEGHVEPLEAGKSLEEAGMWSSERRFARDEAFRSAYPELRQDLLSRQAEFAAQRAVYESEIARLDAKLEDAQPTWWERHEASIAFVAGLVVGTAAAVEMASALHGK